MRKPKVTLAQRVSTRRLELGMSQRELARRTGVSQEAIRGIEGGAMPRADTLLSLASALEVDAAGLLEGVA